MCTITSGEVAVAIEHLFKPHVQFITVNKSQLVTSRQFQLQHRCICIAHHQGDLYISSLDALYKYSLSGKLICTLYDDIYGGSTVNNCAVSPSGDKLYITCRYQLLTVAMDGTVLVSFTDPELLTPVGLLVTSAGQVLVCDVKSHNIIQMDSDGGRKLSTLATKMDGVENALSVCYSSTTSLIIVGNQYKGNILVLRVE
ncbi:hypothetical protein DPMN_147716 [Dreissena polymorpha]|uniref:Uncharacterized protein n=1 Tax=Dreissena polymorpha TaxID=45954 RepID=A0A9D4F8E2_DREPO|nr:hypothetical protein DPMN_147716 [Dreissena polymorpha]